MTRKYGKTSDLKAMFEKGNSLYIRANSKRTNAEAWPHVYLQTCSIFAVYVFYIRSTA